MLLVQLHILGNTLPLLINKDASGKFQSENIREPNSSEQVITCIPDDVDSAQCSKNDEESVKGAALPILESSSASKSYPVISGVKSLAWGHSGDFYSQFKDSDFREILVVSGDNGIVIHAFRNPIRNEVFEPISEGEAVDGKWVEWGPAHSTEVKEFSHSNTCELLNGTHKIRETSSSENVHGAVGGGGGGSSCRSSLGKNWLRTFLTKLDTEVSSGKYLAKFPAKSSLPHSADVVSFDIYDITSDFLEFLSATPLGGTRQNLSGRTVVRQVSEASLSDFSPKDSIEVGTKGTVYRCSRVFNSCSHRLIGLVLNFPENVSDENSEGLIENAGEIFVVIMMLSQWGLQWFCSVNLQDQYPGPGPSPEWADFQFSEDFLVCLNSSGLICMWGAQNGNLVARFDVLRSCGLDINVSSRLSQSKLSVNCDSVPSTVNFNEEAGGNSEVHGRETHIEEIGCARAFRKLMVISHSFLLAVIDEHGVIYVIWAAEFVSDKCDILTNMVHSYKYSDCGMLAGWKVAGHEIGCQKMLSVLSPSQGSYFSKLGSSNKEDTRLTKFRRRCHHTVGKESQLYTDSSGFSTSQMNGWKISKPQSEIKSAPLRKVFLPLEKNYNGDSICFSSFGITRLIRSSSLKQQNFCKIVHTSLHVVSPVLDDTDLDKCGLFKYCSSVEGINISGESIGFSFQGCLYLVTRDGLSVILPSVSVSSSVLPAACVRYWQPNTSTGSESQIKSLLATDEFKEIGRPWQIEVLDRTLLYEGPDEAERIFLENGELIFLYI